jgi:hypothetical protein
MRADAQACSAQGRARDAQEATKDVQAWNRMKPAPDAAVEKMKLLRRQPNAKMY